MLANEFKEAVEEFVMARSEDQIGDTFNMVEALFKGVGMEPPTFEAFLAVRIRGQKKLASEGDRLISNWKEAN